MNILKANISANSDLDKILVLKENIPESYLQDESKLKIGVPKAVYLPCSTDEVSTLCNFLYNNCEQISVSGSRSGIVGGSVPNEGANILSLEKLNQKCQLETGTSDCFSLRVSANISLREINQYLIENLPSHYFPIDPTYFDAGIGGNTSTNAGGSRSVFYGQTREWIQELTVVLSDGRILVVPRGEYFVKNNSFVVENKNSDAALESRKTFTRTNIRVPNTKNSLGPRFYENMDLIDLFIGSEGILGIITEVKLKLAKKPSERWYHIQFFEEQQTALNFAKQLLSLKNSSLGDLLAIEFIDTNSLLIAKNSMAVRELNLLKEQHKALVFVDFSIKTEADNTQNNIEAYIEELTKILEATKCNLEDSISGEDEKTLAIFKTIRHAVPEQINAKVAKLKSNIPTLHKISTDMSVPTDKLQTIYDFYRTSLQKEGLEHYIFGHFGSGHLHLNIIPDTEEKLNHFKESLYIKFAKKVVELGGSTSGEHGIGRLKKWCLEIQFNAEEIETIRDLKSFFDEKWLLNRGVVVDEAFPVEIYTNERIKEFSQEEEKLLKLKFFQKKNLKTTSQIIKKALL